MKEQVVLNAEPRDQSGKGAARRLRREGYVPAVVYGHGSESSSLRVRADELQHLLSRISASSTVIGLQVADAESSKVLIREIQRHPFRADILHVDFFQIREDERIRVEVPLHLVGEAAGVEAGGILQQHRYEVAIECLPGDIPESFEVDVGALEIGDSLQIGAVEAGGVEILDDLEVTICSLLPPTLAIVEEEEEEEAAELEEMEPEVIGRGKEEAEEEEAGSDAGS